jgi:hypothetical protein
MRRTTRKVRIQVVMESAAGEPMDTREIAYIHRGERRSDTVGLTLEEAKTALEGFQRTIVEPQTAEYLRTQRHCSHGGKWRHHKGQHTVTRRTVFGKFQLKSPRLYHCQCQLPLRNRRSDRRCHDLSLLYGAVTK